jgi:glycosyltransferase involved in cell wall biosynthesis
MFVGSFQPWHGIDLLVEIFAQVLQDCPSAKLLLVGDGPARPTVEQKILDLDITNAVIITGLIPHVQIPQMLAIADVVTLPYPSLRKDLWFSPLKLFEYMAAGKAIVASNAGQIAEIIQHGHSGLLIESGNVESFARAVFAILQDPSEGKRLGKNAQEQAVQQFSWEKYVSELEAIYFSVL